MQSFELHKDYLTTRALTHSCRPCTDFKPRNNRQNNACKEIVPFPVTLQRGHWSSLIFSLHDNTWLAIVAWPEKKEHWLLAETCNRRLFATKCDPLPAKFIFNSALWVLMKILSHSSVILVDMNLIQWVPRKGVTLSFQQRTLLWQGECNEGYLCIHSGWCMTTRESKSKWSMQNGDEGLNFHKIV